MDVRRMASRIWRRSCARTRLLLDIDDLTQEAHLFLLRRPDASSVRVYSALRDAARAARRRNPRPHPRFYDSFTPEEPEDHADLYEALDRLDAREQLIVILSYWYRWPLHRIGAIWGLSSPAISKLRSRALARMRAELDAREEAA